MTRNSLSTGMVVLLLAVLGAGQRIAAGPVIWDNGAPDLALLNPGGISDRSSSTVIAEDFSLIAGGTLVADIHWWGGYRFVGPIDLTVTPPTADDFVVSIFANDGAVPGGLPGVLLQEFALGDVGRTAVGTNSTGQTVYEYSADLSPAIDLAPVTQFWVSITNATPDVVNLDDWFWQRSADSGFLATNVFGAGWQQNTTGEFAFQLTTIIPEPGTCLLFGTGLGLLGLMARPRKRQRRVLGTV